MDDHPQMPGRDSCYRALSARDARFDGVFFTGVKSTGIYCRPVCAARTPRLPGCEFFSTAAAAEKSGFRPCLRCRPELAPYPLAQNLALAVWQRIAGGALNEGSLEQLAGQVGLSSRQLRRVVLQHFGVTPVELAQTQRLLFAKKLLQETQLPMADIAYAAGFGSVRRFNALFSQRYRVAPGALRRHAGRDDADDDTITLRLAYRPPLPWTRLLAYLAPRALPGVESIESGAGGPAWLRSVRIGDACGWIRASHDDARSQLRLQLSPSLLPVMQSLINRVRELFDLDANPARVASHLVLDPLLAPIVQAAPGLRVPGAFDCFELAVRAVLGQQVSVPGATTLAGRLVQRFGDPAATPCPGISHHFPRPQVLAALPADAIAAIGLPGQRAATLVELARFSLEGGLEPRPGTALPELVRSLRTVAGIGEWTAQYIALRGLRQPDAFPAGDLGLQKALARRISEVQGTTGPARLDERALLQCAAGWSPWRGYAAIALWQWKSETEMEKEKST
ncbi:AlkA N-terminal domain-containing protein [Lacisediminimonas profundi]|uniref:AlkA N-terminal domain-containing protein n=1 Tax=Lacisediminimonas profundi TaxID=2603856 RepID=UPI0019D577F0|nr:AlkA N-terminal domain-containing protein [Lacisediminimonas profundi]